ncbi:uncharacterized protein BDCG_04404 [Blastomyces dermatitidis ER-3]|uniref:Uncharacterized protein n=1 Tax=Ajellomyces dermatitidis (strain ER-3 / ATCC MYA-2586) TaxID=559297 RepID=A0ABX2VVI1_AJEDR|nr:uncharacterized protein BDCG_04404 [Blastomyces dermatitidis ER-3]OAT01137.1 hypothetical protein BDCG_04404 [Blastomyces dermatitidis ER-3]
MNTWLPLWGGLTHVDMTTAVVDRSVTYIPVERQYVVKSQYTGKYQCSQASVAILIPYPDTSLGVERKPFPNNDDKNAV